MVEGKQTVVEGKWFKRIGQANASPAGLMGAVCSRRARRVIPRNRTLLSAAERWALLVRKARGLQILRHVHAYAGHARQLLYRNHPPLLN